RLFPVRTGGRNGAEDRRRYYTTSLSDERSSLGPAPRPPRSPVRPASSPQSRHGTGGGQVIEPSIVGPILPPHTLGLRRSLVQALCPRVLSLAIETGPQPSLGGGNVRVLVPEQPPPDLLHLLEECLCLGVLPLDIQSLRLVVHGAGRLVRE